MLPVMAYNLLQAIALLASASGVFAEKCVSGITANREICAGYIEKSLALVTGLVPEIGYDKAAAIAKKAYDSGKTIREVAIEENILSVDKIKKLLNS
jgi:fumarate hydratase class II